MWKSALRAVHQQRAIAGTMSISSSTNTDTTTLLHYTQFQENTDGDEEEMDTVSDVCEPAQKRKCHMLKPPKPDLSVVDEFLKRLAACQASFVARGFTPMPIYSQPAKRESTAVGSSKANFSVAIQKLKQMERNKTKRFICSFKPPTFANFSGVSYQSKIAAIFRNHANQTCYSCKRSPTESASQQTTRFQTGAVGSAFIAQQITTELTLSLAEVFYKGKRMVSNPASSFTTPLSKLYADHNKDDDDDNDNDNNSLSLLTCSSVFFTASKPRCVNSSNMFASVLAIAKDEQTHSVVTHRLKPLTNHVEVARQRIVSKCPLSLWISMAFLLFIYREPRLRELLELYGITESEVAFAHSILEYGRGAVSNKSRRADIPESEQEMLRVLTSNGVISDLEHMWNPQAIKVSLAPVETSLLDLSSAVTAQHTKALSKKCRRASSARFVGDLDESTFALLEFVLCASASRNCVMLHMVSESEADSKWAAEEILNWQIRQLGIDTIPSAFCERLKKASENAATNSRRDVMALCTQANYRSPLFVKWRFAGKQRIAIARSQESFGIKADKENGEEDHTADDEVAQTLLVCQRPRRLLRPLSKTASIVLWTVAAQTSKRSSNSRIPLSGVSEAIHSLSQAKTIAAAAAAAADSESVGVNSASIEKHISRLTTKLSNTSECALPPSVSGDTRSVLVFKCRLVVNNDVVDTAMKLGSNLTTFASSGDHDPPNNDKHAHFTNAPFQTCITPPTTPSNPFSVGLIMQETFRTSLSLTSQKRYPMTALRLSVDSAKETNAFNSSQLDLSRHPNELMAVMDISFKPDHSVDIVPRVIGTGRTLCQEIGMVAQLTVIGDSIIPVDRAVDGLLLSSDTSLRQRVGQVRSLIFAAANQACTLNTYAASTSEQETGTNIARTSKIVDPDNSRCGFFCISQCYVVGNSQVTRLFETSPWAGVYGSGYATGAIASPGKNAANVASDKRLTTVLYTNNEQVNDLSHRFAESMLVSNVKDMTFAKIPYELRGIPRKTYAGVHTLLNPLHAAFESLRSISATERHETTSSIQVLPISPWTENVPPLCCEPTWHAFRTGTAGLFHNWHSHRADSTPSECSVMNTPFFKSMRVRGASERDNLYETIDENMANCFVLASAIAQLSKAMHSIVRSQPPDDDISGAMETVRKMGNAFYSTNEEDNAVLSSDVAGLFCDTCVLLSLMYPQTFDIASLVVPRFLERASHSCFASDCKTAQQVMHETRGWVNAVDLEAARHFWDRLSDKANGAWWDFKAFVCVVHDDSRRFDLTVEDFLRISVVNENFVRSTWKVHSADGISPPKAHFPTHCCASPHHVTPGDALGVYVDRPEELKANRRKHRGAIVGVKTGGMQQILTLLQAAPLKGKGALSIRVQHALNEGGMLRRVSSCALNAVGRKAASPVGSENDSCAFGELEMKKKQAISQQSAWLLNNELLFEATRHIAAPKLVNTRQLRGDEQAVKQKKQNKAEWMAQTPSMICTEQREAEALLREAVRSAGACESGPV